MFYLWGEREDEEGSEREKQGPKGQVQTWRLTGLGFLENLESPQRVVDLDNIILG